jgi:hypothetical protein
VSIFDKFFKKEKNEVTLYKKHEVSPQGEAWISSDAWDNIKTSSLIKDDPREKDPHIRGLRKITREEAEAQLTEIKEPSDKGFYVGGATLPSRSFSRHCLITGQTRSGKTTILKQIMVQTLRQIGVGKDQRAVIYDPKGDFVSFLYGLLGKNAPIKILNPFDARCVAWDIGKDITDPANAATVAKIFVPEPKEGGSDNRFFRDGARTLIRAVQESFFLTSQQLVENGEESFDWTLRDLCLALRDKKILQEVLSKHPETKHAIEFLERENSDVLNTAKAYLSEIEIIAAAWQGKEKISLKDFRDNKDGMILVLGNFEEASSPLQALNNVILQRVFQLLLTQPDNPKRRSWIYLDEFSDLGKIENFHTVMQKGLSKGVCNFLSFQNIETVKHIYTKELANALATESSTKIFLKCEGSQAAWVEGFLGKREVWKLEDGTTEGESFSSNQNSSHTDGISKTQSNQPSTTTSLSDSVSKGLGYQSQSSKSKTWRIKDEPVVSQGELANLPEANPRNGISGFYLNSSVEGIWFHKCLWSEVSEAANITSDEDNFISRDNERNYQYIKLWTNEERERAGQFVRLPTKNELQEAINQQESEEFYRNER